MTAPFEGEIRVHVRDIDTFRATLAEREARVVRAYAFSDHYYRPRSAPWPIQTRGLRIREHHQPVQPSEVLLTAVEVKSAAGLRFKQSRFVEGKVRLYAGDFAACADVVDTLGFVPVLTVQKRGGTIYEVPHVGMLAVEEVDEVGWMVEFEVNGTNPDGVGQTLRDMIETLALDSRLVTPDPVAVLVERRRAAAAMNVYFSGAIRGGRSLQPLYAQIVAFLQARGSHVLTAHVADPHVLEREWRADVQASDIYQRDVRWLEVSDVVIAEVSTPSLGVGVELTIAQYLGKPVICLCQEEVALSAMVSGNDAFHHIRYRDVTDLLPHLEHALTAT